MLIRRITNPSYKVRSLKNVFPASQPTAIELIKSYQWKTKAYHHCASIVNILYIAPLNFTIIVCKLYLYMSNISIPYNEHFISYWETFSALKWPNYRLYLTVGRSSSASRDQRMRHVWRKHLSINVDGIDAKECSKRLTALGIKYALLEKPVAEKNQITIIKGVEIEG